MKKRLTEFLDPRTLKPTLSDIAQAIKVPVEKIAIPEDKPWKWAHIFYVIIEGKGGEFGSYRALKCWLEAVIQMLTSCSEWQTLEAMIASVEWELQQDYAYCDVHKQRLKEVLVEQIARLEVLKTQAAGLMKAWNWAKAWMPVLESCTSHKTLDIALKLYLEQKQQYQDYPEVFNFILQSCKQQRAYLRNLARV
jgi:hypothetical protein